MGSSWAPVALILELFSGGSQGRGGGKRYSNTAVISNKAAIIGIKRYSKKAAIFEHTDSRRKRRYSNKATVFEYSGDVRRKNGLEKTDSKKAAIFEESRAI